MGARENFLAELLTWRKHGPHSYQMNLGPIVNMTLSHFGALLNALKFFQKQIFGTMLS